MVRTHAESPRARCADERPTYFRRNPAQWEALEHCVLPWLVAERSPTVARPLRIWSAGCATGEEAFDLALTAHRVVGSADLAAVAILATDRCPDAITKARRGRYSHAACRGTTLEYRRQLFLRSQPPVSRAPACFTAGPDDREHEVDRRLASLVRFEVLDLEDQAMLERVRGLDLLLCRNVFDEVPRLERAVLWRRLRRCVRRGGYLVLGESERRCVDDSVATLQWRDAVVYRAL
ncbi:MAG: hypothetical protein NXI31_26180 [bacterium]|nr:hypothetical protein [bacterium]